jgi:hypothetical protein
VRCARDLSLCLQVEVFSLFWIPEILLRDHDYMSLPTTSLDPHSNSLGSPEIIPRKIAIASHSVELRAMIQGISNVTILATLLCLPGFDMTATSISIVV